MPARTASRCIRGPTRGTSAPHDVQELSELLRKDWPQAEFNIEGNPFHNLMDFVRELRPHQATFVPDSEGQSPATTAGTFPADAERLRPLIAEAKALGVRVSLFMDPEPDAMAARQGGRRGPHRALHRGLCRRLRHARRAGRGAASSTPKRRARRRRRAWTSTPATT